MEMHPIIGLNTTKETAKSLLPNMAIGNIMRKMLDSIKRNFRI
jgi:hypothetical protein